MAKLNDWTKSLMWTWEHNGWVEGTSKKWISCGVFQYTVAVTFKSGTKSRSSIGWHVGSEEWPCTGVAKAGGCESLFFKPYWMLLFHLKGPMLFLLKYLRLNKIFFFFFFMFCYFKLVHASIIFYSDMSCLLAYFKGTWMTFLGSPCQEKLARVTQVSSPKVTCSSDT